jgi:thiol peroxidase
LNHNENKKHGINYIRGNPHTSGELPKVGTQLADFKLIQNDLLLLHCDFAGKRLINIFPSIDTGLALHQ